MPIEPAAVGPGRNWMDAYDAIGGAASAILLTLKPGETLSTADLATRIYSGDDAFTIQRVFKGLKAMAANRLADSWKPGPEVVRMGRPMRPKLWHRPCKPVCKNCGSEI